MLNLDTNVLLAALTDSLRADESRVLRDDPHWAISSLVLWEIGMLRKERRIQIGLDSPALLEALDRIDVLPLTLEIAWQSHRLDFEADPVDEIVAATSIVHQAALMTRDSRMLGSLLVPLATR